MRSTESSTFRYIARTPPFDSKQLPTFINDELQRIGLSVNYALDGQFELQTAAPPKPRPGMIRFADGANWIPGHGAGPFFRTDSGWLPMTPVTGRAVLVGGTVVVTSTTVTANSNIFVTCQIPGGTPGFLRISARSAGASFTILSSSGTDKSTVAYWITEP